MARELYTNFKSEHENVLRPIGFARHSDQIALVHPWMDNGTLREYIAHNPNANRYQLVSEVPASHIT